MSQSERVVRPHESTNARNAVRPCLIYPPPRTTALLHIYRYTRRNVHPDLGEIFYRLNHTGVPDNWGLFSNPDLDELVERGRQTVDLARRREICRQALRILNQEIHFIYLGHLPVAQAWRSRVQGLQTNIRGDIAFHGGGMAYAWIEE